MPRYVPARSLRTSATKCYLATLPRELVCNILEYLPDLESLFSTIRTCRNLFYSFQGAQQTVIKSILSGYIYLKADRALYKALTALRFLIKQDIIQRDIARSIFEDGWEIFRENHCEELLIPFGRALAWSFVLDERRSDAIDILQQIWKGERPFGWSTGSFIPPMTIRPVGKLLKQLLDEENTAEGMHVGACLTLITVQGRDHLLPVAKSRPGKIIWSAIDINLNDTERASLLRDGILFKDNFILVRHSKTRQRKSWHPLPGYRYFRSGLINNHNLSEQITELLAHRPLSSYALPATSFR